MTLTAVSYARYSSDNQREESVTGQLRVNREFATRKEIQIIKEYADEAKSASVYATKKRDEFENMIDDIYTDRIKPLPDYVIFYKVDRFARNDYDFAITKFKLRKKGVKYLYANQEIPSGPEGILVEKLYEGIAEWYSANLSEDVKRGMRDNALAGLHRGGIPPLGFDVIPVAPDSRTKKYIINESEAEIVRIIFKLAKEGSSYPEIVDYLNGLGYKSKIGQPFAKTSIHDILRNPKYGGNYVAGRYTKEKDLLELEGVLPAIIDPELWKEVQDMMDNRRHVFAKPVSGGQVFLLTGKLTCGECGASYTGNSRMDGKKKSRYSIYNCTAKRKKECENKDIQKEILESAVLDKIEELFAEENTERLIDMVMERNELTTHDSQIESKRLAEALVDIQKKMDNLLGAIEGGFMDARIAGARLTTLNQEKEAFERRLIELQSNAPIFDREKVRSYITENQRVLNNRSDMLACKKLIDRYVVKITLFNDDILYDFKIPPTKGEFVSDMVDPRVSVRQTRPAPKSETWINKFVRY